VLFAVPSEALEICLKDGTHGGGKNSKNFTFTGTNSEIKLHNIGKSKTVNSHLSSHARFPFCLGKI